MTRAAFFAVILIGASAFCKQITYKYWTPERSGPKIAVVTDMAREVHPKILSNFTKNKKRYCQSHGYDLIVNTDVLDVCLGFPSNFQRDRSWNKLAVIGEYLCEYDWVVYMSPKILIVDQQIPLERFIDPKYDFLGAISVDVYLRGGITKPLKNYYVSDDIWFIKNSDQSKKYMECVWRSGSQPIEGKRFSLGSQMQKVLAAIEGGQLDLPIQWGTYPSTLFNTSVRTFKRGDFALNARTDQPKYLHATLRMLKNNLCPFVENQEGE